jgi:hypothetical protein
MSAASAAIAADPPPAVLALTAAERGLLARAIGTSFEGPGRSTMRQELARLLDPADRVLDARAYRTGYTRHRVLYAIIRGALSLGTPPQSWSAEDWANVRRAHGKLCSLPLMIVAARGYGVMPGRDYNLPRNTPRLALARALFGRDVVDGEFERVRAALLRMGFRVNTREGVLRQCVADLLLYHGSPSLDVVTDDSLAAYAQHAPSRSARDRVCTVSGALVEMGIVTKRVSFLRPRERLEHWDRLGVTEEWLGWCKRWHAASPVSERTHRGRFGDLMTAGRWLRRDHPDLTSPGQWTLDLAFEYVRFVDGMRIGELLAHPRPNLRMGQPLTPNGKVGILAAMRAFFRDLQEWAWIERRFNPDRGFALPRQVQRSRERNPRPIDEAFWFKLRTASLSLRHEDLPRPVDRGQWRYPYPLELIQALAVAWTFSGCRSDEIKRLEVGCAYVEHVPEQTDPTTGAATPAFNQPMLRVPVNKTRGEFVKPIEAPLLEAIQVWERVRPAQPALRDATTGRMVHHLFCVRGRRVSDGVLNTVIIPILLRKAGLPEADSRGAITSHRARATLATKLYNFASGLGPLEVMNWLGHTHFSSTQHYLALTPVRLMTAFHRGAKLTENLRMVSVLVDSRPEPGQPSLFYDLGHGWCTNDAYAMCAHRMACARCAFYVPADSSMAALLKQEERYLRMLQELTLTEDERAAVNGDAEAVKRLLFDLAGKPTPGSDGRHRRPPPVEGS